MCGIVGAVARRNVVPLLLEGLRRLEYRGYDSAGIAVVNGSLRTEKQVAARAARLARCEHALIIGRGARGGELCVLAGHEAPMSGEGMHVIRVPAAPELLPPILQAVPLQLLAYHAALARGTDVDKPRNLAKSVTVE